MRTRTAVIAVLIAAVCAACAHAAPNAGGGQISTGPSCVVSCITSALIEPHTGAFGVSVHTDTPATILIAVYDPTTNAVLGWSLSPASRTAWAGHVTASHPTRRTGSRSRLRRPGAYRHALDPVPDARRATTQPLGPEASSPSVGCSEDCFASVKLAPQGTSVGVTVDTTVPAKVKVSVDRDAPGTIGDAPFFGTPEAETDNLHYATHFKTSLDGLVPGSTYHVILRATDADGHTAYVSQVCSRPRSASPRSCSRASACTTTATRAPTRRAAPTRRSTRSTSRVRDQRAQGRVGQPATFGHHGHLMYFPLPRSQHRRAGQGA
jgi:hypothetical protein